MDYSGTPPPEWVSRRAAYYKEALGDTLPEAHARLEWSERQAVERATKAERELNELRVAIKDLTA